MAIVDDLGAVVVISLFYTETISIPALIVAGVMLKSGVHATLAGIFLAFTIPMRPKYDPERFVSQIHMMVRQLMEAYKREGNIIKNQELRSRVHALGKGVNLVQAPA